MMDALGFKGIWKKSLHDSVLVKLRALEGAVQARKDELNTEASTAGREPITLQVTMLSDTIVIAASSPAVTAAPRLHDDSPYLLLYAAACAAAIMQEAAATDPALIYRGVMSWGEFEMDDRFLVGQPIDEAAQLERSAEAAVVWLAPSAAKALGVNKLGKHELGFVKWNVPMMGGGNLETSVVNPFHWLTKPEQNNARDQMEQRILASFDDGRVEVQIKKQNTAGFLAAAKARVGR